jgi:hypothetical protein
MRFVVILGLLGAMCAGAPAQELRHRQAVDSDHDGLTDVQEQALLQQFAPTFLISPGDCASRPAEFEASVMRPVAVAENGTIYGQAFPRPGRADEIELHYYDLWRKDCGQRGHDLDAEHVSVLVARDETGSWKARYWYAAAQEDTLCDASQIAKAKTLNAELHAPEVWVSSGKHGAFLGQALCKRGCGADECGDAAPLSTRAIVNLGEPAAPMNGATWADFPEWPLGEKMRRSDFSEERLARLKRNSADAIAWANPGKRHAEAVILGGDAALGGATTGAHATASALDTADEHSSRALENASSSTGTALGRAYRRVLKALGAATGNPAKPTGK